MGDRQEHTVSALLRQAVDRHPAECAELNHAEHLRIEPAVRHFVGGPGTVHALSAAIRTPQCQEKP